ncbi:MAG: hypothetical protein LBC70_04615 [Chitinispirillales bacterium]|nr:hypothetical protein [Chitinispirillales bacterium]
MKPKHILSSLTALWVIFVTMEGLSSVIRLWYSRKMNLIVKATSGLINSVKAILMVILAVSNVILFMRHVEDK